MSEGSWIAWSSYSQPHYESITGEAVWFPTPTDCLLWFRWIVLPQSQEVFERSSPILGLNVSLSGVSKRLAEMIDSAPDGTSSGRILKKLEPFLESLVEEMKFQVRGFDSIHECLSCGGAVNQWRLALKSPGIRRDGKMWSMPRSAWLSLEEVFAQNGFEPVDPKMIIEAQGKAKKKTIWKNSKMLIGYWDEALPVEEKCEVRISEGGIAVSYVDADIGFVVYHGRESGKGHFELKAPEVEGRATLHRFENGEFLEGHWIEEGWEGFWKIELRD